MSSKALNASSVEWAWQLGLKALIKKPRNDALDSLACIAQAVVIIEAAHEGERQKHECEPNQQHHPAIHQLHAKQRNYPQMHEGNLLIAESRTMNYFPCYLRTYLVIFSSMAVWRLNFMFHGIFECIFKHHAGAHMHL